MTGEPWTGRPSARMVFGLRAVSVDTRLRRFLQRGQNDLDRKTGERKPLAPCLGLPRAPRKRLTGKGLLRWGAYAPGKAVDRSHFSAHGVAMLPYSALQRETWIQIGCRHGRSARPLLPGVVGGRMSGRRRKQGGSVARRQQRLQPGTVSQASTPAGGSARRPPQHAPVRTGQRGAGLPAARSSPAPARRPVSARHHVELRTGAGGTAPRRDVALATDQVQRTPGHGELCRRPAQDLGVRAGGLRGHRHPHRVPLGLLTSRPRPAASIEYRT